MTYTFNENGIALTETNEGVTMPADYSFDTVNDFVHCRDAHYEDLQCLCLAMSNHIEKLQKFKDETRKCLDGYSFERIEAKAQILCV